MPAGSRDAHPARPRSRRAYNFRFDASRPDEVGIALDDDLDAADLDAVAGVFARALQAAEPAAAAISADAPAWPAALGRTSAVPDAPGVQHAITPKRR